MQSVPSQTLFFVNNSGQLAGRVPHSISPQLRLFPKPPCFSYTYFPVSYKGGDIGVIKSVWRVYGVGNETVDSLFGASRVSGERLNRDFECNIKIRRKSKSIKQIHNWSDRGTFLAIYNNFQRFPIFLILCVTGGLTSKLNFLKGLA